MDSISLRGLRIETVIGTHDWERRIRQTLLLDLDLSVDARPAAASDRIADTVDYSAVAARLQTLAAAAEFRLVEALAEACARLVVTEFGVAGVRLTLHKPGAVRAAADVALTIERGRADYAGA